MRRSAVVVALDRYAASNANSVLVADPHSGPRRAKRAKRTESTSQGRGSRGIRILRASLWLVFVASAGIGHAPVALGQTGAGWVTLFDGKDFSKWTMTGNANWRIADGLAEADMPRGFLVSRDSYGDFELRADVWARPESNGGILFRITDARDPGIENGYELNINDTRKDQDGRTGSIVNVAKPIVKFDSGNIWTTVEIRAVGPKMTARLNGTLTAEATDTKYARGPVALQAAGGLVRYRNVQIREIK